MMLLNIGGGHNNINTFPDETPRKPVHVKEQPNYNKRHVKSLEQLQVGKEYVRFFDDGIETSETEMGTLLLLDGKTGWAEFSKYGGKEAALVDLGILPDDKGFYNNWNCLELKSEKKGTNLLDVLKKLVCKGGE
jgi:hypothetical protein